MKICSSSREKCMLRVARTIEDAPRTKGKIALTKNEDFDGHAHTYECAICEPATVSAAD